MTSRRSWLAAVAALAVVLLVGPEGLARKGGGGKPGGDQADLVCIRARSKVGGMSDNEAALMVLAADGSSERVLLAYRWDFSRGGFNLNAPTWSPDGSRIAFVMTPMASPSPEWGVHVVGLDGSGDRQLTYGGVEPAWSPDGTRLAYAIEGEIRLVDADGTSDVALGPGNSPTWAPDGERLAYIRDQELYVHEFGTETDTNVTAGGPLGAVEVLDDPAWAKAHDWIVLSAGTRPHVCADDPRNGTCYVRELWIIDLADPLSPRQLTNTPEDDGFAHAETSPSWSADDARVFFSRGPDLFAVDADGTGETLVAAGNPPGKWSSERLRFPEHRR